MKLTDILNLITSHFVVRQDMEDEQEIIRQIKNGVTFRGSNLWVLVFAIFIASLGLNVNSTAVIIGAMLISPLMGPIIGMGLAIGINDVELLKRAARNFGTATLISVLTATVYFLITPLGEAQSELLARTSPTLYDVLIATFGGAAGILALCTKGKGNVIPGVAIATALMPPLCTAGYGLATGHLLYFLGAFYLFFINTVFISLATYLGVRLMHFRQKEFASPAAQKKAQRIITGLAVVTMLPAVVMTVNIVRKSIFDNNVNRFVHTELSMPGTQVISTNTDKEGSVLNVVAVGREISTEKAKDAERRMAQYGLGDYALNIIQGEQSDSMLTLTSRLSQITTSRQDDQKKIMEMSAQMTQLRTALNAYERYATLSQEVMGEMKVLFPKVKALSMSKAVEAQRDTTETKQFVAAKIVTDAKSRMTAEETSRLQQWLKERVKADSLVVVY